MKDKINDQINRIITKHVHTYCNSDINYHSVQGVVPAADELTALMCYREVRAFVEGRALMEWVTPVIIYLKGRYESTTIIKAIERVKKEIS
jgi:hypothetical protein